MKTKILGILFSAMLLFGTSSVSRAQDYNSAIGLNLGAILGINYKQFVGPRSALEFGLGYQMPGSGVMVTAVYQYHIGLVENFKLYVGGGLNIGVTELRSNSNGKFALGIDPNVGFEYKFKRAPIALALDYQPQINFVSSAQWGIGAFKIRFVL